jgi:SOS-response transcriptional repressor LexA
MTVLLINRDMTAKRKDLSFEECVEKDMTPAQREVFLCIDEWWKKYGFGPSIRDICNVRGKAGMGNTSEIISRLVKIGVLKKVKGAGRSVRPVYINFRTLE